MAYEKADFYAAYAVYPVDPVTRHRYARFKSPNILNGQEITLRLHYHPVVQKPYKLEMAKRLVGFFVNKSQPLLSSDRLVIVGGAFGWTGEALEDLVPGLEAVSVDLSQYVQDEKELSPDDELIESLVAEGHAIDDDGVGQFLYEKFTDPNPRTRDSSKVLNEDLSTVKSRNAVKKALTQANPTRIITEEVWQVLSQAEKDKYTAAAQSWGVGLTHVIDGVII